MSDLVSVAGPLDLIADSLDGILAVAFPKSRALRYPMAVELARAADKSAETTLGKSVWHLAAFGRTQEQAARALAIAQALRGQKAEYFARGERLKDTRGLERVLQCYLRSCDCADPAAHCVRVIGDPFSYDGQSAGSISTFSTTKPLYYWPCAFMLSWNTPKLQCPHPASPDDQLQARAVALGCHVCPNFRPELKRV